MQTKKRLTNMNNQKQEIGSVILHKAHAKCCLCWSSQYRETLQSASQCRLWTRPLRSADHFQKAVLLPASEQRMSPNFHLLRCLRHPLRTFRNLFLLTAIKTWDCNRHWAKKKNTIEMPKFGFCEVLDVLLLRHVGSQLEEMLHLESHSILRFNIIYKNLKQTAVVWSIHPWVKGQTQSSARVKPSYCLQQKELQRSITLGRTKRRSH